MTETIERPKAPSKPKRDKQTGLPGRYNVIAQGSVGGSEEEEYYVAMLESVFNIEASKGYVSLAELQQTKKSIVFTGAKDMA